MEASSAGPDLSLQSRLAEIRRDTVTLANISSSPATGLALVKTFRTQAMHLAEKIETLVDAAKNTDENAIQLEDSEVQALGNLYRKVCETIAQTGTFVVENQNLIMRFFYRRFCDVPQEPIMKNLLKTANAWLAHREYTARVALDAVKEKPDVAIHAKFDCVPREGQSYLARLDNRPGNVKAPQTQALKSGNEMPIIAPPPGNLGEWAKLLRSCATGQADTPSVQLLPITEKTATSIIKQIADGFFEGEMTPSQADVCNELAPHGIEKFDTWNDDQKKQFVGTLNLLLSVLSALPLNSAERTNADELITKLLAANSVADKSPFSEVAKIQEQLKTSQVNPGSAAPCLPNMDELFSTDAATASQYAMKKYKGMEFMQHARSKPITLFTDAVVEKFATYATNPDAMRHMQAVIKKLPNDARTQAMQKLAQFANKLAASVKNASDPNKSNQLRAIGELLLANRDVVPAAEQLRDLLNVSGDIIARWDHSKGIDSNEIAVVVQLAALKKLLGVDLSAGENKHIALLTANPCYGFCQRVYNTAALEVTGKKFDPIGNPNFRAYYGSEDSLISMDAFKDIAAIGDPSEFITAGEIQSAFNLAVRVDRANGLILGADGKLLVATREKPPLIRALSGEGAQGHVAKSLDGRSTFPNPNQQVIDGIVTVDLTTGAAVHGTAGKFVMLPVNLAWGKSFMAFQDKDGVVRAYPSGNFREPAFLIKAGEIYSSRNPDRKLYMAFPGKLATLGLSFPIAKGAPGLVGWDESGNIAEVIAYEPICLKKGKDPAFITCVRNKDSGRLELFADGQPTDRYLLRPEVLKMYFPLACTDVLCTASASNPRELALLNPGDAGSPPAIITLPEEKNGAVVLGRVKSDGGVEGDIEARDALAKLIPPFSDQSKPAWDSTCLRGLIAYSRTGRTFDDSAKYRYFGVREEGGRVPREIFQDLLALWETAKKTSADSEYITLLGEAILEVAVNDHFMLSYHVAKDDKSRIGKVNDELRSIYQMLKTFNPSSQILQPYAQLARAQNLRIANDGFIDADNTMPEHILSSKGDRKFYESEVARFKKQGKARRMADIRAHLPKLPKSATIPVLTRVDLMRGQTANAEKMAGATVRPELFDASSDARFDLATVGAAALEILRGDAENQSEPITGTDAAVEPDETPDPAAPKAERERLEQHRQRGAEETQLYAEALWKSLAQHFGETFDLAHPENFHFTNEEKTALQKKLAEAEESLGRLEGGIPIGGDVEKVYNAYLRASKVVNDILMNVSANVKQMRLYGTLPMPKLEQLQMLLFSCYDQRAQKINEVAFSEAYRRQFDPYATPKQIENIIEAIHNQMICKTALDASKTRVREFANFKKKIEQLITPPATMGAESRKAKLAELNKQKTTLQKAREICQRYCAQEKAQRQLEGEKTDTTSAHEVAMRDSNEKIARNRDQQKDIQRQINNFRTDTNGCVTGNSAELYDIDSDAITRKLTAIDTKIASWEEKITTALPGLKKSREQLQDNDTIVGGYTLALGYGKTTYKYVKDELAALEAEKQKLNGALLLKEEKDSLVKSCRELEDAAQQERVAHEASMQQLATRIGETAIAKQGCHNEFTKLQNEHAELLGGITLAEDRLTSQTLDGEAVLVLQEMEERVVAKDQEIEALVSDTQGRMLAVKEAYGSFIKSMAAARAYDANDMGNFFTMWFESQTGFRLRPDQVTMIGSLVQKIKSSDGNEQEVQALFQLMMGGGKTAIILSQMAQMLAGYGKIALFANHSSQHETMTKDLRKYQKDRYDQEVIEIDYPLTALRGEAGLEKLDEIQKQFERAKQTGACITTQSTMLRGIVLERRNAVIKLNECRKKLAGETDAMKRVQIRDEIGKLEVRLKKAEKLLSFIHENCSMICDEVDLNLDPTFSVNIPNGEKATFNPTQADCIRKFFKIIDGNSAVRNALRSGTGISEGTLGGITGKMLDELGVDKGGETRRLYEQFVCYDDTPGVEHGELEDQTFRAAWNAERVRLMNGGDTEKELLERLSMLRGLIGTERYASKKAFLESYGFRVDGQGEADVRKKTVKAVPYSAANTPSSGEYAHPIELAVYTHHAYLLADTPSFGDGSPLALKFEAFAQKAVDSPDSSEGRYLEGLISGFAKEAGAAKNASTPASRENLVQKAFKQLATIYGRTGGDESRNLLVAMLTASDFTFFPAMLEGTGYGQTHLTKFVIADSGTPWNAKILSVGLQDSSMLDETTDMRILDKWEKDMAAGNSTVFQMQAENPTVATMLDGQTKSHGNDGKPTCALIDVAGSFKYLSNRQVAEQARTYYAAHGTPFKGFAFFDTAKKSWFVLLSDPSKDPIELSNCAEETVLREAGVTREQLFVYYDQNKTTGVDFKLPQSGRGLVTTEKARTLLSRFLQGILRLRGFWDGQTADIYQVGGQPDAAAPTEPGQHANRLCELFGAARQNQDQLLGGRKVGAFVGQLTERKREVLERAQQDYHRRHEWAIKHGDSPFVPSRWKRKYEELQAAAAEAFTADSRFDPSGWYASLKGSKDATEHVAGIRQTMASSLAGFGLTGEFMAATNDIVKKSAEQLSGMQTAVGGASIELGTQVEQQAEAEAEQQMEVSTSSMSGNDGDNVGRANRDQRYAPNAKLDAGVQMGPFMKALLIGVAGELTAGEKMRALGLVSVASQLAAIDDLDKCKEGFEQNLIEATSTPKIPIKFFDALAQKAMDAEVETDALVTQMRTLQKDVDKIFKAPAHEDGNNPEASELATYLSSPELSDLHALCGGEEALSDLARAMTKAGLSLDQAKQFASKLQACATKVNEFAAATQQKAGGAAAEQTNESGPMSLKDLRNNPKRAGEKLQGKLTGLTTRAALLNGAMSLLEIFTKDGQKKMGKWEQLKAGAEAAVGAAEGKLKGTGFMAGAMGELAKTLGKVNDREYVEQLDAARTEKVLAWFGSELPQLLGRFFVKNEVDAAGFFLKVALKLTLPPADPASAQKKLAAAILDGSKDLETGQYDMAEATKFLDKSVKGYADFIGQLFNSDGPMIQAITKETGPEIANGLRTLLGKLETPLFTPMLNALKGVKGQLLEQGGQAVDQLPIRLADAEPGADGKIPTRKVTDGAKSINAWLKDSQEAAGSTDAPADIFPTGVLASEQFMKPFEYGNDPASPHFARNAQRMLAYRDSSGSVRGMLITDTELDSYGAMIKDGTLKNAYFMDTEGKIDSEYLPPTCEEGVLPTGDTTFCEIQNECPRLALCMKIYNGSVDPAVLAANPTMKNIFQSDVVADPGKKSAVTAFLGAKTSDTTWIEQVAIAA
jgi:hypothetical protein